VGISRESRKSRAETPPMVSKRRHTRRRPVDAAMLHSHPLKVNATDLPRRQFLHLAAGAAALPAFPRMARAQAYPARPVRIIVPFPAGGPTDISARLLGQWLSERLGQPFVIETRPGAGSNLGTEAVVHSPPDGYTLLLVYSANAINGSLYGKLNFNFIRDIAPVAGMMRYPFVMVVNPSVSAKTVPELIAYAKANPGRITFASGGIGTPTHISGELFKMIAGVNLLHVPYRGGAPALIDVLGGQVQMMFATIASSIDYVRTGKLRPLAVTSAKRFEALPDVPTMAEFLPGFEASAFQGIGAPKGTSAEIIDTLNKAINAGITDAGLEARIVDLGGTPLPGTPASFGKLIADETEKWASDPGCQHQAAVRLGVPKGSKAPFLPTGRRDRSTQ
jgi:tripartite-type tricarboxylate transporter receptor subunit TctC